jgi:hypothetical protein
MLLANSGTVVYSGSSGRLFHLQRSSKLGFKRFRMSADDFANSIVKTYNALSSISSEARPKVAAAAGKIAST